VVCLCVCLLVTFVSSANTDEQIEMPFRYMTRVGPRNHVLDGGQFTKGQEHFFGVVQLIEKHCESLLRCTQQVN